MTPSTSAQFDPVPLLAAELGLPDRSVTAAVALLSEGATVPFIARYRKEATGGMDEVAIRTIEERRAYLIELEDRRGAVIAEIEKQGKLTPELTARIKGCATKAELEDLYLPFKPKRRTRASIAREKGLEPLADLMWLGSPEGDPMETGRTFVDEAKGVQDVEAALAGARDICAERVAENADARKLLRERLAAAGVLHVRKEKRFADSPTKFDTYADFNAPVANMPSHRFLAVRRGENEGVLGMDLELPESIVPSIERIVKLNPRSPWAGQLSSAVADAYERLMLPSACTDLRVELKLSSDREAVQIFAKNLRELLLAAPLGGKRVLGVDPGQRTGCKCAVVAETGAFLAQEVLYLVQGDEALERSRRLLVELIRKHRVEAVAVGNGTHGRETESFVRETLKKSDLSSVICVPVSEAGASVYSASKLAGEEFPNLDLTLRGAISIARRLQDPLAELVKIDPKSIGVGQYQHDVYQPLLGKKLDEVVESCVNLVGVEVNTASAPLLSRVAGIGPSLAQRIVEHRDREGAFKSRRALRDVTGLGAKTFEQAAGFLRVRGGEHPLDASAVHPERYDLVERMAQDLGVPVASLIGNTETIGRIATERYVSGDVGNFTLNDILTELRKPGRDPRSSFEPPRFRDDVRELTDLAPGMTLEGVVTNVTAFGAFVDIGVHQDGLVHISQLADRFVRDPSEVVRVGDRLTVRILEVDIARKRIALSCRKDGAAPTSGQSQGGGASPDSGKSRPANDRSKGASGAPRQKGQPAQQPPSKYADSPFAVLLNRHKKDSNN